MINTNDLLTEGGGRFERLRFQKHASRLIKSVPITKVIGEYTKLHGSGRRLTGNCPRHETPNPMLRVYPRTNTFQCGFCGVAGDAIDFLGKVHELTYGQALEALEQIYYSDNERDAA